LVAVTANWVVRREATQFAGHWLQPTEYSELGSDEVKSGAMRSLIDRVKG